MKKSPNLRLGKFLFIFCTAIAISISACRESVQSLCLVTSAPCCQSGPEDPCKDLREELTKRIALMEPKLDVDIISHNGCPVVRNQVTTGLGFDSLGAKFIRTSNGPFELSDESVVETCPCDTSLLLIDTFKMPIVPNELSSRGTSKEKSNGNGIFVLPPNLNLTEDQAFIGSYIEGNPGASLGTDPIKVAIIDAGLSQAVSDHLNTSGQIESALSLVGGENYNQDQTGHGDVVTVIVDEIAANDPVFLIYRIIDNNRISTSYKLACALKCAKMENADIVNMSLGNYINDTLLYEIIEEEYRMERPNTILIASKGNDCLDTGDQNPELGHYPSDYGNVLSVIGLNLDVATKGQGSSLFQFNNNPYTNPPFCLWECSNRQNTCAAPCKITDEQSGTVQAGTSFSTPFVTGKCIDYMNLSNIQSLDDFVSGMQTAPIDIPGGARFDSKIVQ